MISRIYEVGTGVLNLAIIAISIVPYIVILTFFYREKNSLGGSYKIMFHLGIADCIQLIFFTPCWLCHFLGTTTFPFALNKKWFSGIQVQKICCCWNTWKLNLESIPYVAQFFGFIAFSLSIVIYIYPTLILLLQRDEYVFVSERFKMIRGDKH
ncbi:hypothetical protein Tcan_12417 [Toxocara canis]|uniref:Uncharacterized protein n=1 Tax=Toxocara canis TaxID=6265 RepID=A0A0B2VNP6_TOXCA|nr:hypothetical protein Tcan_12417 [Toxocara canis]